MSLSLFGTGTWLFNYLTLPLHKIEVREQFTILLVEDTDIMYYLGVFLSRQITKCYRKEGAVKTSNVFRFSKQNLNCRRQCANTS